MYRSYDEVGVLVLSCLLKLATLKELRIQGSAFLGQGQVGRLTALTSPTRLDLIGLRTAAGDAAAVGVSCMLQLQHLELQLCDLGSMDSVAAIGQLTRLTELRLEGNDLPSQSVPQLIGLSRLRRLGWGSRGSPQVPLADDVLEQFWATVRQHQQRVVLAEHVTWGQHKNHQLHGASA
jgi:hypothetical protein